MKKLQTEVAKVIGWEATKGEILSRGDYASTRVRAKDGLRFTLKTCDDADCAVSPPVPRNPFGGKHRILAGSCGSSSSRRPAPSVGDMPRWDRWENEQTGA